MLEIKQGISSGTESVDNNTIFNNFSLPILITQGHFGTNK